MPFNYDQHIDDYLQNKLSAEDRADFEEALVTNKELKEKYDERMAIVHGAKQVGRDELKKRLQRIHQEVNSTPAVTPAKQRSILPYLASAAAAIALLVVSWFVFFTGSPTSPSQLYAKHYAPYELRIASRDQSNEIQLAQLDEQYKQKNYSAALPLFEEQLKENPSNAQMLLGAGICQLELDQPTAARQHFKNIISYNDLRLQDQARWYTALSYLKENQPKQALPHLKNIKKDKETEAQELINLLMKLL